MTSLTTNEPKYQPGFEDIDTSVRGVISFSGALDMVCSPSHPAYFCKQVANLDKVDMEFMYQHSPTSLIPKAKDKLVPFLLFSGGRDRLTESIMSTNFKAAYDLAIGASTTSSCELVMLPVSIYYIREFLLVIYTHIYI